MTIAVKLNNNSHYTQWMRKLLAYKYNWWLSNILDTTVYIQYTEEFLNQGHTWTVKVVSERCPSFGDTLVIATCVFEREGIGWDDVSHFVCSSSSALLVVGGAVATTAAVRTELPGDWREKKETRKGGRHGRGGGRGGHTAVCSYVVYNYSSSKHTHPFLCVHIHACHYSRHNIHTYQKLMLY